MSQVIGLIAGKGQFPLLVARAARAHGYRVVVAAIEGDTPPELEAEVDSFTWLKLGQVGGLIKVFKAHGVTQALMAGAVTKPRMFSDLHLDMGALGLLKKIRHLADDGILRTLTAHLEDKGIKILPSHQLLPELLAPAGCYTRRDLSATERENASLGWDIAAELGRLDIGQSLVIKDRAVVAVEAMEGTDACILRGGQVAGEGAVVVKRCKPQQDRRFDLPTVGVTTIETMARAGCSCLVIEARRTLAFDRPAMAELADRHGIAVAAWPNQA